MSQIDTFTAKDGRCTGTICPMAINVKAQLVPNKDKASDSAPDYGLAYLDSGALRFEQTPAEQTFWRCVEVQLVVFTLQLVDVLEEQHRLEDILEVTKPPVPPECEELHDLYMTPFRCGLYPNGSRFRRDGPTPGVYYVLEQPRTAIIETAFLLLLFYSDSPGIPFRPSHATHSI